MSETLPNFEGLLREALAPVEPPQDMVARLEGALLNLTEIAAEELDSWELSAMRDPRNWVRPVAAVMVGSSAGAALVVLRARHRQRSLSSAAELRQTTVRVLGRARARTRSLLDRR